MYCSWCTLYLVDVCVWYVLFIVYSIIFYLWVYVLYIVYILCTLIDAGCCTVCSALILVHSRRGHSKASRGKLLCILLFSNFFLCVFTYSKYIYLILKGSPPPPIPHKSPSYLSLKARKILVKKKIEKCLYLTARGLTVSLWLSKQCEKVHT